MKKIFYIAIGILIFPLLSNAQSRTCMNEVRPVEQIKAQFVSEINVIFEYYMSSPDPEAGSNLEERKRNLQIAVNDKFRDFKEIRTLEYKQYKCRLSKEQSCTGSTGNRYRCPAEIKAPANMIFIKSTVKKTGSGFKDYKFTNSKIKFVIGVSGDNRNVGKVTVDAQYTSAAIAQLLNADLNVIRTELTNRALPVDNE